MIRLYSYFPDINKKKMQSIIMTPYSTMHGMGMACDRAATVNVRAEIKFHPVEEHNYTKPIEGDYKTQLQVNNEKPITSQVIIPNMIIISNDKNITDTVDSNVNKVMKKNLNETCKASDISENKEINNQRLKDENTRLKSTIKSLKQTHTKELETQAEVFRCLLKNQKETLTKKLSNVKTKVRVLSRKVKRKEEKIQKLLLQSRYKSTISKKLQYNNS